MNSSAYERGLDRSSANHLPLTPLGFLDRAALVHPDRAALVHGDLQQNWNRPESAATAWLQANYRPTKKPSITAGLSSSSNLTCRDWRTACERLRTRQRYDPLGSGSRHGG